MQDIEHQSLSPKKLPSSFRKIVSGVRGDIFILLALPLLLLCVNQDWIFTNQGLVDPWMYLGHFLNLPQYLQTFAGTYYSSRLPFLLPGYLAYKLFPPLVANYVLHLGFYYTALISLYLILKYTTNRRTALITAIAMGYYPYFLGAMGWDYVDSAGITYFLLTLLMLTQAARSPYRKAWLCLSGMFYGALIYTNLFLITLTPSLVIYYFFTNWKKQENSLYKSLLFFSSGFGGITLVLGTINYLITGDFLFFLPSVTFSSTYTSQPNPYKEGGSKWIDEVTWLILPSFTFLSSFLFLSLNYIQKKLINRYTVFFQVNFILTLLIMVFWELRGLPVLQDFYYSSYLIPSMFLAIGTQFTPIINRLKPYQFIFITCSVLAIFLIPLALPYQSLSFIYSLFLRLGLKPVLGFTLIALITVFLLARQQSTKYLVLLAFVMAFTWMAVDIRVIPPNEFYGKGKTNDYVPYKTHVTIPYKKKDCFVAFMKSMEAIRKVNLDTNLRFWYNFNSPLSQVYHSIGSGYLLWLYRLVNDQFPTLQNSQYGFPIDPNSTMVILSEEKGAFQKANNSLNKIGLNARLLAEQPIQSGEVNFTITFIKTDVKGQLVSQPTDMPKDISQWNRLNNSVALVTDKARDSVKVTTNHSIFDWQLISPAVQVEQNAKYLMQVNLKIEDEGTSIHVLGSDQKTVLATRTWCKVQTADFSQKQFIFDTTNNDKVFVVVANYGACTSSSPKTSTFWLNNLDIRQIQPVNEQLDSLRLGKDKKG